MKNRRWSAIILAMLGIVFFGWMTIPWLTDNCPDLPKSDCQLLWGMTIASMLGGVLLAEVLVARRKAQGKGQKQNRNAPTDTSTRSGSRALFVSIAWVTLSALLASLPLIFQGAYVVTVGTVPIGMAFSLLVRSIIDRLPPTREDQ